MLRFVLLLLLMVYPSHEISAPGAGKEILRLKWNKAYPDDSVENAIIGLQWGLSQVGALLPHNDGITASGETIAIDLEKLGFGDNAQIQMEALHASIRKSGEYRQKNAIDLGRYIALLLGASEHYYAITGVPENLQDMLANYSLGPQAGYVDNSGVSLVHRKIQFSNLQAEEQFFLSSEVDSSSGKVYEFETIDIMANGQVRFGIFDADGKRRNSSNSEHTQAGKPAKCLWCHESKIERLFNPQKDFAGYLPSADLQNILLLANQRLDAQKKTLSGGVDFTQKQQHTFTELLYISFMEPSAERLALEWDMPVEEVRRSLSGLKTHTHDEFAFLGILYDRAEVEKFAPFRGLPASSSVREQSAVEVNHIK